MNSKINVDFLRYVPRMRLFSGDNDNDGYGGKIQPVTSETSSRLKIGKKFKERLWL